MDRIGRSERRDRVRLYRSENIGPVTFAQLLARFGSAAAALDALPELSRRGGLSRRIRICPAAPAEQELAEAEALGAHLVLPGESGYPPLLTHSEGAPPFLYASGNLQAAQRRIVAIVGARNASAPGCRVAADIASGLGGAGFVVASGLARGIDAAAHKAALATGTIAVLGGGHGRVYPPEHGELSRRITEQGLLLSEMAPSHEARARDFPRRNRIVSGVALGVVVVEAALRSGSLITARLAGEQGRELFAVPGSPLDPRAEGTNRLIREGATLVRHAGDVIEALDGREATAPPVFARPWEAALDPGAGAEPADDSARARIAGLLSPTPVPIDELARQTGLPISVILLVLTELELAGRAVRQAGGKVSLRT